MHVYARVEYSPLSGHTVHTHHTHPMQGPGRCNDSAKGIYIEPSYKIFAEGCYFLYFPICMIVALKIVVALKINGAANGVWSARK